MTEITNIPYRRVKIGFMTLRDLAMLRPPLRQNAMDVLLSLTTHTGTFIDIVL